MSEATTARPTQTPPIKSASGLSLHAIIFAGAPATGDLPIARFEHPAATIACRRELPADSWQTPGTSHSDARPSEDCFLVITIDPGEFKSAGADQAATTRQAEQWLRAGVGDPVIRNTVDGGWVLYRPGRVVICAPQPNAHDLELALTDVQFHDLQLRKLEHEIAADWDTAQTHIPLAHRTDLKRAGELATMTHNTLSRRMRCARIERGLIAPVLPTNDGARRLGEKLREQLDIEDRLETLDGQIEVYEDLYELANQRLSDYSSFFREMIVEVLIVVLLAAEVGMAVISYFSE
jgi:hypothetical protein